MRVGHVIGKVTLNQFDPGLKAGRFLLVNPVESAHFNTACTDPPPLSDAPSLVVFDSVGAGQGDIVGFVEGGEATVPFESPIPIDALAIALFDKINHHPVYS